MTRAHLPVRSLVPFVAMAMLAVVCPSAQLGAQTDLEQARTAPLDRPLPTTTEVTVGTLDNGLRYFIRENSEPENRAFLRLVVNVGSLSEETAELGVAHYLEHMAFNGTEHFEKRELVAFLESIGMRLGAGLNARTSFDETVYMLTVPTDVPEHMDKAMQILEDWARALTLDPAEIELERGVVLEEWRGGQGAGSRIRDQHLPVLFSGSRYAERLPIGTPESIETIDREELLGFYRKWYRPELMAVVAVGDFEAASIEGLIRRYLARVPSSSRDAPARVAYDVPSHEQTLYSVAADPEQTTATVEVVHEMAPDDDWTVGGFRRRLVEQLYNGLLSLRLQEIAREPDAPFVSASSQTTRRVRASASYSLSAAVLENDVERGLNALLSESARVARFGFTETELERGKTSLLRAMERRYASRDSRQSAGFAEEYTQAFLLGRPAPSIEYERALYERFVSGITLDEVNAVGRRWLDDSSRVVLVTAPEKEGLELPGAAALAAVISEAAEADLEPYVDKAGEGLLIDELPARSSVVAERMRPGDLTEWDLANGIQVVLKPTDFNKDEIVLRGFFPGGASLAEDEDFVAAQTAVPVITTGGLAGLDITALQKALTGKVAVANPTVSEFDAGIAGQASAKDLQTLFELIYLRFTAPRADANAFATLQNQMRLALGNRDSNPVVALNDAFIEPRSQTRIAFPGAIDMKDPQNRTSFAAMGVLLQNQLREALREELGGTYNVGVRSDMRWVPVESGATVIEFGSDPERSDELTARIFAEIADLKRSGPSAERLADVRASMLRAQETNLRQNGWWLVALAGSYQYEANPGADSLLGFPAMVEALTPEAIREGIERHLDMETYVRVTLLPEQ
jgi:zinc protease